ncbi:hypothetical protein GZL_03307 [Streptomyces sp. 769]|nr:hypothetical protein GZL_03307 [Streptomyces sp. 769]
MRGFVLSIRSTAGGPGAGMGAPVRFHSAGGRHGGPERAPPAGCAERRTG